MIRTGLGAIAFLLLLGSAVAQDDTSHSSVATGPDVVPVGMRIMHAEQVGADVLLHVALLDSLNRPISGRTNGIWTAAATCRDSTSGVRATVEPGPFGGTPSDRGVAAVVVIDNSAVANGLAARVTAALRALGPGWTERDSVGVLAFDHDLVELSPIAPAPQLATLSDSALPAPFGLSGVYNALMAGLGGLRDQGAEDLDLVLIAASDDNASLAYDAAAVVRRAREGKVRITTVRLGTTSMGYVYRYMAAATGGCFVQLSADASSDAAAIVRQVVMARRAYTTIRIPDAAAGASCAERRIGLSLALRSAVLSDSTRIVSRERSYRPLHTIVTAHANGADTAITPYRSQIAMLAEIMAEDTTMRIELVGHVDKAYKGNAIKQGSARARRVAQALLELGIASERIQVRSEGASRPLYYFEMLPWQQRMNDRVEMRRLGTDELPYTIVVDQVATEEHAARLVETWETRGYQAYFDPIISKGAPAYRIVLWGYATRAQAQSVARTVRSSYKTTAVVE